jgi:hypothetical protein
MNANTFSPVELAAARDWLADCSFPDVEPDEFATMPDLAIVRGVAYHFDGGIEEFRWMLQSEVVA